MVAPTLVSGQPTITDSPGRHVLYVERVASEETIGVTIQAAFAALYGRINEPGIAPAGPPFVIYKSSGSPWEMEICAPVAVPMAPSPDFLYRELPATRVASLLHVGPYEMLGDADALNGFMHERGLDQAGSPREIYMSPPETPSEQVETIIEWPIA